MAWVRVDADVERNRKVLDLRARLGWSPNDALARLVRLFAAVREQTPSGDLSTWTPTQIARAMEPHCDLGDVDALLTALVASGLFHERDGCLLLSGWAERNGDWLDIGKRSQQRSRAGKARAAHGVRDASGRYLPSGEPAKTQRTQSPSEASGRQREASASQRPDCAGPATTPATLQRPVSAGPDGPAQPVAEASASQRAASEGPAQPAIQYKYKSNTIKTDSESSAPPSGSLHSLDGSAGRCAPIRDNGSTAAPPTKAGASQPHPADDERARAAAREAVRAVAGMFAGEPSGDRAGRSGGAHA